MNKISDIDKESWDLLEDCPENPHTPQNTPNFGPSASAMAALAEVPTIPPPPPHTTTAVTAAVSVGNGSGGKNRDHNITAIVHCKEVLEHQTPKWHPERPERVQVTT